MIISEIKMRAKLDIKWILFLKMTHYSCGVLSTLLVTTNLTHAWVDLVIHDITRCPYSLILMCWLINHAITTSPSDWHRFSFFSRACHCQGRFPRISLSSVTSNRCTEQQFVFFPSCLHTAMQMTHINKMLINMQCVRRLWWGVYPKGLLHACSVYTTILLYANN